MGINIKKLARPERRLVAILGDDEEKINLPFVYNPSAYSLRTEEKVFGGNLRAVMATAMLIVEYLTSWELEREAFKRDESGKLILKEGKKIPLLDKDHKPLIEMVPITLEAITEEEIPRECLNAILAAINRDQLPPKEPNDGSDTSF